MGEIASATGDKLKEGGAWIATGAASLWAQMTAPKEENTTPRQRGSKRATHFCGSWSRQGERNNTRKPASKQPSRTYSVGSRRNTLPFSNLDKTNSQFENSVGRNNLE